MAALIEGLQVVDLTDLPGALAGRLLADMGADVIRIAASQEAALAGLVPWSVVGLTHEEVDELVRTGVAT